MMNPQLSTSTSSRYSAADYERVFSVVVTAIAEGRREDATEALQKADIAPTWDVGAQLNDLPWTVRRSVSRPVADTYKEKLTDMGLVVEIRRE
jgi:hypothetical protein